MKKTHVIIGGSAVGLAAFTTLSRLCPHDTIIAITKEDALYNTCLLADYLAHNKREAEIILPLQQAADAYIMLNTTATLIKRESKHIVLASGQEIGYDTLLLGTGSRTRRSPEYAQWQNESIGVFNFYTLADARAIKEYVIKEKVKEAVVIGAGFTGLECADALRIQGLKVHVIERQTHILPAVLGPKNALWLKNRLQKQEIFCYTKETVIACTIQGNKVTGVKLASGKELPAQLIVYALGSEPVCDLAHAAGITVDKAIVTDMFLQTADSAIFAAGDCALVTDITSGLPTVSSTWPDALKQGVTAAHTMAGDTRIYQGVVKTYVSKMQGLPIIACGVTHGGAIQECVEKGYTISMDNAGRVIGFTLLGNVQKVGYLKKALLEGLSMAFVYEGL